jgi:hypothetical protein
MPSFARRYIVLPPSMSIDVRAVYTNRFMLSMIPRPQGNIDTWRHAAPIPPLGSQAGLPSRVPDAAEPPCGPMHPSWTGWGDRIGTQGIGHVAMHVYRPSRHAGQLGDQGQRTLKIYSTMQVVKPDCHLGFGRGKIPLSHRVCLTPEPTGRPTVEAAAPIKGRGRHAGTHASSHA